MSTKEKLIRRLKSIPSDFSYTEMKAALESMGFKQHKGGKTGGSRVRFSKDDVFIVLHKPHPRKELPEYQIRKVLRVLESEDIV